MSTLKDEAEALLAKVEERERTGAKLSPDDRALILRIAAKGNLSQEEIAKAVGCSQPTVSRVLALLDTRKEAQTILESGASKLAQTVVDTDDAAVALKALAKLDVVREDREVDRGNRVTVIVGMPGAPVKLPDIASYVAPASTAQHALPDSRTNDDPDAA